MLGEIVAAVRARSDLQDWSVRRITTRGVQLYAVPTAVEARRSVTSERYVVEVFRHTAGSDGAMTMGSGNVTLLPGDDIDAALDAAALTAGLVHNPMHSIPGPAALPDVPLVDSDLKANAGAVLDDLHARLRAVVAKQPRVRLPAAEFFAEEQTTQLCNSRGIDASQTSTTVDIEFVLLCREGEREVESFVEMSRRRAAELELEAEVARQVQYVTDRLEGALPPNYSGPVVLQGETLGTFLNGGVLRTLSSGAAKFSKISPWEIGQPVFRGTVEGDPLTVFANRRLPFGTHANRFDEEGLPAQRVLLIRENVLQSFTAGQRYADYLEIAPTGAFGDIEVPAGSTPAAELLREPHVEVVSFSWFNPDPITGEFASEIRLGYLVDGGKRTPFKGGVLVGNVLDALANVRWSAETGFYGDYQGPTTARFASLTVAGEGQG